MNNTLRKKIWDILSKLTVDDDQLANYEDQWEGIDFYLNVLNYKGREVRLEDVLDMIMEAIKEELLVKVTMIKPKMRVRKTLNKYMKKTSI